VLFLRKKWRVSWQKGVSNWQKMIWKRVGPMHPCIFHTKINQNSCARVRVCSSSKGDQKSKYIKEDKITQDTIPSRGMSTNSYYI